MSHSIPHEHHMESDDDDEGKLEIVDEDSTSHDKALGLGVNPAEQAAAITISSQPRIYRKSISFGGALTARFALEEDSNASDAIESLLLLGKSPVVPLQRSNSLSLSPIGRRYSSGSDPLELSGPGSDPLESLGPDQFQTCELGAARSSNGDATFYQRMRERNNEASKRCRLKRRLKAESMEKQANLLTASNNMLKNRIRKMEKIADIVKKGVAQIQKKECLCFQTIEEIKKINCELMDEDKMSNKEILASSMKCRQQSCEPLLSLGPTSEDENSISIARNSVPTKPKASSDITPQLQKKTALDVINDTIVNSLKSSSPTPVSNLPAVKLLPRQTSISLAPSPAKSKIFLMSQKSQPLAPDKPQMTAEDQVIIKCEPEVQIFECGSQEKPVSMELGVEGVDRVASCIASSKMESMACHGDKVDLNKLTSYLDLTSMAVTTSDSGNSAMERAVIKSRLKVPFWQADEYSSLICDNHRQAIISHGSRNNCCVLCSKNRTKKQISSQTMMIITYRMSLEYYTTTGNILPIGYFVCGQCKEKHLRNVDACDPSNPKLTINLDKISKSSGVSITPVSAKALKQESTESSFHVNKRENNQTLDNAFPRIPTTIKPIIQLLPKHSIDSAKNEENENLFHKAGRLNDALKSINPNYQPTGFSITSVESCPPAVFDDAVSATGTAISTLLSVIAPGQEAFLWKAVKPKLDAKFLSQKHPGDRH